MAKTIKKTILTFYSKNDEAEIELNPKLAKWITGLIRDCSVESELKVTIADMRNSYLDLHLGSFEDFLDSENFETLKDFGLLIV